MSYEIHFYIALVAIIATLIGHAYISGVLPAKRIDLDGEELDAAGHAGLESYLHSKCKPIHIPRRGGRTLEDPEGSLCPKPATSLDIRVDEHVLGASGRRVKVTRINDWIVSTYLLESKPVFSVIVLDGDARTQFEGETKDRVQALDWHDKWVLKVKSKLYQEVLG